MRKSSKVVAAAGIAVLVAAGGAAFTGTGVTTSGTAASAQFVGGAVTQDVTGATLSSITYGFANAPVNTQVNEVTLQFDANAVGKTVALSLDGTKTGAGTGAFACGTVDADTHVVVCDINAKASGDYKTGVGTATITVS